MIPYLRAEWAFQRSIRSWAAAVFWTLRWFRAWCKTPTVVERRIMRD